MLHKIILLLSLFLMLAAGELAAQQVLVFAKEGRAKRFRYNESSFIELTTTDGRHIRGTINYLDLDFIQVAGDSIALSDIRRVYRRKPFVALVGYTLQTAGVVLLVVHTANGIADPNGPVIDGQTAAVSGGIVAAGTLLKFVARRKLKVADNKWRARIIIF